MPDKYELGTAAWFNALRGIIERQVQNADPAFEGIRWAVCEVFTDVPPGVSGGPDRRIAWHCYVRGREVSFGLGEISDADFKVVADYQTALSLAHAQSGEDPTKQADVAKILTEGLSTGKIRVEGSPEREPLAFKAAHDEIVRLTA